MSLGERIYKLRSEKEMSQGDLADALEVSRQSISKWETNASVPELDKLVKMSEVFHISLDELILDKKQDATILQEMEVPEQKVIYVERTEHRSSKKTVGIFLLCFAGLVWLLCALLGAVLEGFVFAAPFVACGLICMYAQKNAGLWCLWTLYLFVDIYLRFATGVNWQFILQPLFYNGGWTIQLIVAWINFVIFFVLTIFSGLRSWMEKPCTIRSNAIGVGISIAVYVVTWFIFALPAYEAQNAVVYPQYYRYFSAIAGWARNGVFAVAIVFVVRLIQALRENHKS